MFGFWVFDDCFDYQICFGNFIVFQVGMQVCGYGGVFVFVVYFFGEQCLCVFYGWVDEVFFVVLQGYFEVFVSGLCGDVVVYYVCVDYVYVMDVGIIIVQVFQLFGEEEDMDQVVCGWCIGQFYYGVLFGVQMCLDWFVVIVLLGVDQCVWCWVLVFFCFVCDLFDYLWCQQLVCQLGVGGLCCCVLFEWVGGVGQGQCYGGVEYYCWCYYFVDQVDVMCG